MARSEDVTVDGRPTCQTSHSGHSRGDTHEAHSRSALTKRTHEAHSRRTLTKDTHEGHSRSKNAGWTDHGEVHRCASSRSVRHRSHAAERANHLRLPAFF